MMLIPTIIISTTSILTRVRNHVVLVVGGGVCERVRRCSKRGNREARKSSRCFDRSMVGVVLALSLAMAALAHKPSLKSIVSCSLFV